MGTVMEQGITPTHVMLFLAMVTPLAGFWLRVEWLVGKARSEAAGADTAATARLAAIEQDLGAFKLECSRTYVHKTDLREIRDELIRHIDDVKTRVETLNGRMDRVIEGSQRTAESSVKAPARSRTT